MPFLRVYCLPFTVYGCVRSWILLLHIFIRLVGSNDFVDLGGESGDDVLRNVPYNIVVDSHVVVNQFVAHAGHFAPESNLYILDFAENCFADVGAEAFLGDYVEFSCAESVL